MSFSGAIGVSSLTAVRRIIPPTVVPFVLYAGADTIWTDMPAAVTPFRGSTEYLHRLDLSTAKDCRLFATVVVAGAAGADLLLQSSPDLTTWTTIVTLLINAAGQRDSGWVSIPQAARVDNMSLRIAGQDGDALLDPSFRQIVAQIR